MKRDVFDAIYKKFDIHDFSDESHADLLPYLLSNTLLLLGIDAGKELYQIEKECWEFEEYMLAMLADRGLSIESRERNSRLHIDTLFEVGMLLGELEELMKEKA